MITHSLALCERRTLHQYRGQVSNIYILVPGKTPRF